MITLFDQAIHDQIRTRIDKLTPATQRQWGKMNVGQMLAHCSAGLDMQMGTIKLKRVFIGRIIGPLIKKMVTSNDEPFKKNSPTAPELTFVDERDFNKEKERLIGLVDRFTKGGTAGVSPYPHPFFGKMSADDWGIMAYKHLDHHLSQFGV